MAETGKRKKVVKVDAPSPRSSGGGKGAGTERVWTPSAEAKSQATRLRVTSWVLWIVAILGEVAVIIWVLPSAAEKLWLLLVLFVPIGVLAVVANLLWKKANRLDPASRKNATKFFIQNQLGAIMTVLAFLPLIILILLDKNLDGKQKAIAGGLGAVLMIGISVFSGISWDGGPSQEQYAHEENIIMRLTGVDEVFWVKGGSVFHVCAEVPDVNRESKDGQIYQGTVAAAHAAGKDRLTARWESEAINYCGYTREDVDAVNAGLELQLDDSDAQDADASDEGEEPTEDDSPEEDE